MKRIIYIVLFLIIAPLQWVVSLIDQGLSAVWQHVTLKLLESRMKDNEKEGL